MRWGLGDAEMRWDMGMLGDWRGMKVSGGYKDTQGAPSWH